MNCKKNILFLNFSHAACEEDRESVACMLVKAGATMDLLDKEKKTPLDLCSNKLKKMLTSLLE